MKKYHGQPARKEFLRKLGEIAKNFVGEQKGGTEEERTATNYVAAERRQSKR